MKKPLRVEAPSRTSVPWMISVSAWLSNLSTTLSRELFPIRTMAFDLTS